MKVKIGKYPSRLICDIHRDYMLNKYETYTYKNNTKFESFLEKLEDAIQSVYNVLNKVWFDHREQQVDVRIDNYDTWSMDDTLAPIILPMLKQLKEQKHGAPNVDIEDVTAELRPSKTERNRYNKYGETDPHFFKRWDWILDEMIWAFEQKCRDDWQGDFTTCEYDLQFEKIESGEYASYSEIVHGPNHTAVTDWDALNAHQKRMSNGFRLFGKYYECLWS